MKTKDLVTLFILLIIFVLVLLLAQWLSTDIRMRSEDWESNDEQKAPVRLSVWIWEDDAPVSYTIYDDYKRANPNMELEITVKPVRAYMQELKTALAANEQVDVFNVDKAEQLATMIEEGLLYPLNELISRQKFDTSIYSTQFDRIKFDGVAYALPYRFSVFCIAYNKSMFRERGVPFPHDHMTWEELFDLARRMTFYRGDKKVYGIYLINRTFDSYFMAFQKGCTLVDDNLELFAQSLRYKSELIKEGVCISPEEYEGRFIRREFEQENVAMYLTADWTINQMRESYQNGDIHFEFDVAALPSIDGKAYGRSFGQQSFTAISSECRNPEAAFKLASYYAGVPGARRFAEGGLLPAVIGNNDIIRSFIGDGSQAPANIRIFVEQTTHLMMPVLPGIEEVNNIFLTEAELVCTGKKSVEDAMRSVDSKRREIMSLYNKK
jgi:multiple sugar transport system substrate-binding protein